MQYHKGKTFIAPSKLFRGERALYFPNLHGRTLAQRTATDTTPVLQDRISIVSIFSSTWAVRQTASFAGDVQNPELGDVIRGGEGMVQKVDINVEDDALKAWLVQCFFPFLRRRMSRESHGRYFLVRKGLSSEIAKAIGFLNGKVGYVYLLDRACRIRWAGSGVAQPEERHRLANGTKRLLDEWRKEKEDLSLDDVQVVDRPPASSPSTAVA